VLSTVPELDPVNPRPVITLSESTLDRFTGRYEFAPGVIATVTREGTQLQIEVTKVSLYLPEKKRVALDAVSPREFRFNNTRLLFDEKGLTLNPGHWPLRGKRLD
jgi:hypothetical protein